MRKPGTPNHIISEKQINELSKIQLKSVIDCLIFISNNEELSNESKSKIKTNIDNYLKLFQEIEKKKKYQELRLKEKLKGYSFIDEMLNETKS